MDYTWPTYLTVNNMQEVQTAMNSVRTSVEWGFGVLDAKWEFMTYYPEHKIRLTCCSMYFKIAAILTNMLSCLAKGNIASDFFGVPPPSLLGYLAMAGHN